MLAIPTGISVSLEKGTILHIKGKLGSQKLITDGLSIKENKIVTEDPQTLQLIRDMFKGVTTGFKDRVYLSGVGYRASLDDQNKTLSLWLGFKDEKKVEVPADIDVTVLAGGTIIEGKAGSKQKLGEFFASLIALRSAKKDVYKGKGIKREPAKNIETI